MLLLLMMMMMIIIIKKYALVPHSGTLHWIHKHSKVNQLLSK
jgi:hypothetical protein